MSVWEGGGGEATAAQLSCEILDHSNNAMNFLTLEALQTRNSRPRINTRDEFRSRELTLQF